MEGHVTNQYYVPRFLLKHFSSSDENTIWCYDKVWKKSGELSISKVATERYFYDAVEGQKEVSWEYLLSKVESATAPIIKRVSEEKTL
ncbi:MAG: DUF4238 domain-containing protein [Taibaiella sp.]|jgi:hypothetical protein